MNKEVVLQAAHEVQLQNLLMLLYSIALIYDFILLSNRLAYTFLYMGTRIQTKLHVGCEIKPRRTESSFTHNFCLRFQRFLLMPLY